MDKILRADAAGPAAQRLYDGTHVLLAGLVPIAAFAPEHSYLGRTVDVALGVALPLHSHVAINSVLSDYVPKSVRGAARFGALASSTVMFLGLMKLNFMGPGISATVKQLWKK